MSNHSGEDCIVVTARLDPAELSFVTGILDAYENFGVLHTTDYRLGLVDFWIAPDFYEEFRVVFTDLCEQVDMQIRWPDEEPAAGDQSQAS